MIKKILFQNYKAFKKGEIKLKPITILLGANSVGKSSIINLLLMLQQTANVTNYKSALKLNGENVGMGECENIYRNCNTSENLILEFEFSDPKLQYILTEDLMSDLINSMLRPLRFGKRIKNENAYFDKNGEIKKIVFSDKNIFQNLLDEIKKLKPEESGFMKKVINESKRNSNYDDYINSINSTYDLLSSLSKIGNGDFMLSFEIQCVMLIEKETNQHSKLLKVHKVVLKQTNIVVLSAEFVFNDDNSGYKTIILNSDYSSNISISEKSANELLKSINYNSTIFSVFPKTEITRDLYFGYYRDNHSIFTQTIFRIFSQAIENIEAQFATGFINHVSPLRAYPQRYYFLDKANMNTYLNSLDGNSLTEILKENKNVRDDVNRWLEKFNLNVNVDTLHDVINKLKIRQNELELDITDVGFGISQILPVIVQGFMSETNSITMIEQPEIHLHPKMQADLAELFIQIVNTSNRTPSGYIDLYEDYKKCLLIETHSEYLLRRLRRKISEKEISALDVAIYFIIPKKDESGSAEIQSKEVYLSGYFEYPKDFMDENLEKDMISFINQQLNK